MKRQPRFLGPVGFPPELLVPSAKADSGETLKRFNLLISHYGLDATAPGFTAKLCARLLFDWTPIFWRKQKSGRPISPHDLLKRRRFLLAVRDIQKKNPSISDARACVCIKEQTPHSKNEFSRVHPETLRRWVRMAKREEKERAKMLGTLLMARRTKEIQPFPKNLLELIVARESS